MKDNNEYKTCPDCCYDILDDEGDVMEHECISDNEMIAEFMGYVYEDDILVPEEPQYDSSWDWLMPVVDKIESLGYWVNRNDGDITISNKSDMVVITPMSSGGIDMMYKAVVEFIKIHNDESNFLCGSCGEECSEYTYSEDRDVDECNDCKTSNDEQQ